MIIKYRKSTARDWKIIQKLNVEVCEHCKQFDQYLDISDPYTKASEEDYKNTVSNPEKFCMIAELNGEAVGYLAGGENNNSYRTNRRGEIFHMGTSPIARSMGIGSHLVSEFKKWCTEKGITHIAVNAYYDDEKVKAFYEKQGMKPIDITFEGLIN